jgi:hypothetical protein
MAKGSVSWFLRESKSGGAKPFLLLACFILAISLVQFLAGFASGGGTIYWESSASVAIIGASLLIVSLGLFTRESHRMLSMLLQLAATILMLLLILFYLLR